MNKKNFWQKQVSPASLIGIVSFLGSFVRGAKPPRSEQVEQVPWFRIAFSLHELAGSSHFAGIQDDF